MKKFFEEFKKFITRGNVLDLAVGVIVGGSFTAIVNSLGNQILKPVINYLLSIIFGKNSLSGVYSYLLKEYTADGQIDLVNSIYIDWGSFINAVINFLIVAFVLFCLIKAINKLNEQGEKLTAEIFSDIPTKQDKKKMKELGIKLSDIKEVKKYMANKNAEIVKLQKEKEDAEKLKQEKDRKNNPTTEQLLKEILEILKTK